MLQNAMFGAGCFWGVEHRFQTIKGVVATEVGYAGGTTLNPTYMDVCSNTTGHAEVVRLTYDPDVVSYRELLGVFFGIHNPTTLNRQGLDIGSQYRSVIFYTSEEQRVQAEDYISQIEQAHVFSNEIVTQILPAPEFYRAEEYHQKYHDKHKA